jgi:hypothetical protein
MNTPLPPPDAAPQAKEQAEAHLLSVAVFAALMAVFGLPAGIYIGAKVFTPFVQWATLAVLLYVGFVSTIVYWFSYRARNPSVRVPVQSVLMWLLVQYAILVALLTATLLVWAALLASQI